MTTEYVLGFIDLGLKHLYSDALHRRIANSAGVEECCACEGGFSVLKEARDIQANRQMAKALDNPVHDFKPMRDLRFSFSTDTNSWILFMADAMPWTRDELERLVDALRDNGIPATLCEQASIRT